MHFPAPFLLIASRSASSFCPAWNQALQSYSRGLTEAGITSATNLLTSLEEEGAFLHQFFLFHNDVSHAPFSTESQPPPASLKLTKVAQLNVVNISSHALPFLPTRFYFHSLCFPLLESFYPIRLIEVFLVRSNFLWVCFTRHILETLPCTIWKLEYEITPQTMPFLVRHGSQPLAR